MEPSRIESADQAPRARPLTYPGRWPPGSALMTSTAERPIKEICGVRVGDFLVDRSGGGPTLDDVLHDLRADQVADRVPVLAIGSNAAGSQLRHKARQGFPLVIPMLHAEVTGVTTTYASFVSGLGYVPATLAWTPGVRSSIFVQLLDDQQLAALDGTETGYARVELPPAEVSVVLGSGEQLDAVYAYVSHGGYLAEDGAPIPLGDQSTILDVVRTATAELTGLLGNSAQEAAERARDDRQVRDAVNSIMRSDLATGQDQLAGRTDFMDGRIPSRRYGQAEPPGGDRRAADVWLS